MSERITPQDLALLADVADVLEHSVDADEVPPGKEWCYVDGPGAATEVRMLHRKLSLMYHSAGRPDGTPADG